MKQNYLHIYLRNILKMSFLFLIIFLIISAFTFSSRLAGKSSLANCDVNISAHNGSATLTITMTHVGVKVKGGWWATDLINPDPMNPGDAVHTTLHALFNCNVNRRFRFKLKSNNVELPDYCYFPSEDGWTTNPDVDFGDLSTHFH